MDFHEVTVWRTNMANGSLTNGTVRFNIQASTRLNPEKGLIIWTPYPPIPSTASEFAGAQLRLVLPQNFPLGLDIPVAAWVDGGQPHQRLPHQLHDVLPPPSLKRRQTAR